MTAKRQNRFGTGIRRLEELEPRTMLAGHGFETSFAESRGGFVAAAQTAQAFAVAPLSQAFHHENFFADRFSASDGANSDGDLAKGAAMMIPLPAR